MIVAGGRWKEQAIHGRIFRDEEEVRSTVTEFRVRYNTYGVWRNWASCHSWKPGRLMPSSGQHEMPLNGARKKGLVHDVPETGVIWHKMELWVRAVHQMFYPKISRN